MLTTIPWKDFLALTKGVKEDNDSKKPFKWDEMLKYRKSYKYLYKYISETDCKYVGAGSARTAYFLPVGAYDTKYLNEPSCFKVAKDPKRGPAQNEAEVSILERFGSKEYACFPKLYDWDGDKYYFMLCEVGTPIESMPDSEIYKFMADWNPWIKEHYPKYYSNLTAKSDQELFNVFQFLLDAFHYGRDNGDAERAVIQEMGQDLPKYKGIADFVTFMFDKGGTSEVLFGDFEVTDNWGMVARDGILTMIPIDWGFTNEVANKYYS